MAKTYETLANSGLHYESPTANPIQHAIEAEVQKMIEEYRQTEEQHRGFTTTNTNDTLRAVGLLLRLALVRTSGMPKARAFADFLLAQLPEQSAAPSAEQGSRIIVP